MLMGLLNGMDLNVLAEQPTHVGQIDLVVELTQTYYILELKLNSSPQAALDQIHAKGYFQPYLRQGKQVALVGVNFTSQARNIADWVGELLDERGQLIQRLVPAAGAS